jgi:hypothetical protein
MLECMIGCGRGGISTIRWHGGDFLQDQPVDVGKRVVVFRARGSHGKKESDKQKIEKA